MNMDGVNLRLDGFVSCIRQDKQYIELLNSINENKYPIGIFGISESVISYITKAVHDDIRENIFIFANNEIEARIIFENVKLYTNNVYFMPSKELVYRNIYSISKEAEVERLKIIKEIEKKEKKIIVASINILSEKFLELSKYSDMKMTFKIGDTINVQSTIQNLIKMGYERVESTEGKGEFTVKGGIIDIFSTIEEEPYRIELFGDEIESLRKFEIQTQRSTEKLENIEIFIAKEAILNEEIIQNGIKEINEELKKHKEENKDKSQNLLNNINELAEKLENNWIINSIEPYYPYFYKNLTSFLDYDKNATIIIPSPKRCIESLKILDDKFDEIIKYNIEKNEFLKKQENMINRNNEIILNLEKRNIITIDEFVQTSDNFKPNRIVKFNSIIKEKFNGKFKEIGDEIKRKVEKGYSIVILTGNSSKGARFTEALIEENIECRYEDSIDLIKPGEVIITYGSQKNGFELIDEKIILISNNDLYEDNKRKEHKKFTSKNTKKINSFVELNVNDRIVHVNSGIGIYRGIAQINLDGVTRDYIEIEYADQDKLFVPVEQLDLVQKYIGGGEGKLPKITKLGGNEWSKAKTKAKNSINEIAEDLVKLYAKRSTLKGYRYSEDTVWQKQFEEEFLFDETEDQLTCISEIKKDMESDKLMDRLLCGDVGYGKTEVALRAAFKCVMEGKQVAILVPTTILAEQHYNTIFNRTKEFGLTVDMLSRFRSTKRQNETIKKVKEGNVDILIGTHQLFNKKIEYKDLGLLIIDEEQRFGVGHKEKIKEVKKNVDVLTLSATPIPRTLHMSLVGVRDISIINTPPRDRFPVQTYIIEYNDEIIRDAIERELARDGQVFFVHNRVDDLDLIAKKISDLVPYAKVGVAHGRMTERKLEDIMMSFINNDFQVLVSTTIIETGIDIPNVNTIIIDDADKMGLSQLYQLRGRVGRSNKVAYAYFTYKRDKVITEVAEKRLKAIKDFTELGSGFKIAMRDLEIRGTGNLLGSSQHGHMGNIGYDLYVKMLEDKIKVIQGKINEEPLNTIVDIKVDAYIPTSFIESESQKIEIYKKIAVIDKNDDFIEVKEELEDRFQEIPSSVYNLMNIALLKSIANKIGIIEIKQRGKDIEFKFNEVGDITSKILNKIIKSKKYSIKREKETSVYYTDDGITKNNVIERVKKIINDFS